MKVLDRLSYHMESKSQSRLRHIKALRHPGLFRMEEKDVSAVRQSLRYQKTEPLNIQPEERKIVASIKDRTRKGARNNVTRTESYRSFYFRHPELHWAFLAHMVSRNSGWCMTDLEGEWLPRLLPEKRRERLFDMYERANFLIFQDAFPQLLLYEESRRQGRNLFHLLPAFHVSRFMRPFWDHFWNHRRPVLLTTALIINEQHYIEKRVIQDESFQQDVFHTLPFIAQELLQLTQVVFPYREQNGIRLAGLILEHFAALSERIEAGRQMYAMLFGIESVSQGAAAFAGGVSHTGSRRDYWPGLFTSTGRVPYRKERIVSEKMNKEAPLLYSPRLDMVWRDREPGSVQRKDWFVSTDVMRYVRTPRIPYHFDMTGEYCFGLNKLERVVLLQKK
ncbi:DUF2515 family protein [Salibacterium sp. K-3]